MKHPLTGIEELRRVVRAASMTRESAFDGFTAEEIVRLLRACWGSKWDILPDDLTLSECKHGAKYGKLTRLCEERLDARYGDAPK